MLALNRRNARAKFLLGLVDPYNHGPEVWWGWRPSFRHSSDNSARVREGLLEQVLQININLGGSVGEKSFQRVKSRVRIRRRLDRLIDRLFVRGYRFINNGRNAFPGIAQVLGSFNIFRVLVVQ